MRGDLFPTLPILLVDDEAKVLHSYEMALRAGGVNHIRRCQDSREVRTILADQEIEVVVLDLLMPHLAGEKLLEIIHHDFPEVVTTVITGVNEVEKAVQCMKLGAFDFFTKPIEKDRFASAIKRAIEFRELRRENDRLKKHVLSDTLEYPEAFSAFITQNRKVRALLKYVESIALTTSPVLITGETGVGKELIARAVHALSRPRGPFVPVNVAGLDNHFFSDTLFGHKKGAFSGAGENRAGLVEKASGGTLFLDEIGELSSSSQVKLLRLIQEREFFPLGSDILKRADARVVVATNQNLVASLESGQFRKDLYFRLRTHHVHVPPLREHRDDLPLLVEHYWQEAFKSLGQKKIPLPAELLPILNTYSFPGNIRELQTLIFDTVSSQRSRPFSFAMLKRALGVNPGLTPETMPPQPERSLFAGEALPTLKQMESLLVEEALHRSGRNQAQAAKLLGITRQALNKRLKNVVK